MTKIYKNRFEWSQEVETIIGSEISKAFPRSWNEDHITYNILQALRFENSDIKIEKEFVSGNHMCVQWDAFKNTKKLGTEQKYGDIAVLVRVQFAVDQYVDGVAFFEAKLATYDANSKKCTFSAVKEEQLARLMSKSVNHRVIFYDQYDHTKERLGLCLSIPTAHAHAIKRYNREIYKYCEQWAYTLTNRTFRGYELNYDKQVVSDIINFANTIDGPDYLIVAHTTISNELKPELDTILKSIAIDDMHNVINEYPTYKPNLPHP